NLDRGDPAEQLRGLTGGRGPDAVLEGGGHETPFTPAILSVRAGGPVSPVGGFVESSDGVPGGAACFQGTTLKNGIRKARDHIAPLMPLIETGKLSPTRIITHTMGLREAPKGYAIFDRKEDRAIKVMLKP